MRSGLVALILLGVAATARAQDVDARELAIRHAPYYRFHAWSPGSDPSGEDRNEDYFPLSCRRYFDQLASGRARVIVKESHGRDLGESRVVKLDDRPVIDVDKIRHAPDRMAGDLPGTAPVYFHAFEEKSRRVRHADGSGSDLWFVEYWLFYGQDASRDKITKFGWKFDLAGHKGDWEDVSIAVKVKRGAGGKISGEEIDHALYTAHGRRARVETADFDVVDANGVVDPRGTHMVVYVAVGKHASYPRPGYWRNPEKYAPWVIHDEYFRGNGFHWRSWESRLLDLEGPRTREFAPPSFLGLLSSALRGKLADWRDYKGYWGSDDDLHLPVIGTLPLGQSPTGPKAKDSYGAGDAKATAWRDIVREAQGLDLSPRPDVVPAPLPVRD